MRPSMMRPPLWASPWRMPLLAPLKMRPLLERLLLGRLPLPLP